MPPTPQVRRALIAFLFVAQLAMYAGAFVVKFNDDGDSPRSSVVAFALAHVQVGGLVTRAILGSSAWPLNFGLLLPLFLGEIALGGNDSDRMTMAFALPLMALIIAPLIMAIRYGAGYRLAAMEAVLGPRTRFHFGIRHVMALTVAVAILMAVAQHVNWGRPYLDAVDLPLMAGFVALPAALLVVGAAWLALATRWRWGGILVIAAVATVAIVVFQFISGGIVNRYAVFLAAVAGLAFATFFILRLAGYRLIRVARE